MYAQRMHLSGIHARYGMYVRDICMRHLHICTCDEIPGSRVGLEVRVGLHARGKDWARIRMRVC